MTITERVLAGLLTATLAGTAVAPAVGPATAAGLGSAVMTTARVTKVIDGDTLGTTNGKIRLIGVDTPETGQCNAAAATAKTKRITPVGSRVTLILPAGENNTDTYGRKLRYVSRNGVDLGGALIKAGLADARYDSLDGFPYHPKQGAYRAWDARYPDRACTSSGNSSGSGGKYTGCRAYGPNGTSTDDQGRRYTKIDCTTKKPL